MGFTFWNYWQKNTDLFRDILIFLDVPVDELTMWWTLQSIYLKNTQ